MANFVMSRVCFTVVRSDREGWAFDMFDALNTTGQPLTAFETFRPIVIQAAGIENYRDSQEFKRLNEVTEFLGETSDGKASRTEKLIIHARLYQRGEKMPKRLAVQRVWMKRHYEEMTVPDRMTVLNGLANIAEFTSVFAAPHEHLQLCKDSATQLALMQLSEIKHDIVVPVLTRFLSLAKAAAAGETQTAAYEDLRTAIRATVAFATLWRIAKGGTEKIDDCFRVLMRGDLLARTGAQVGPYCTQSSSARLPSRLLSIGNYVSDLNAFLAEEVIASEDDWVKRAIGRAAYSEGSQITRFFLAAAMNDTICDPASPGLLKRGRVGTSPMLTASAAWKAEGFHIEHIAPQNGPGQTWSADIYQNEALKHSLGNLTLLPGSVNGAIKDWAWEKKRAVFGLLSTADLAEATRRRTELTEIGTIPEFPTLEKVVADAHFYSHLQPVADTQVWDAAAINARSENLCRLGHQQLTKWLRL
jgi:hypothetical protein